MMENIPESVIITVFILILIFVLHKMDLLKKFRPSLRSVSFRQGKRTLKTKYSFLKGPDFYIYAFKRNEPIIFHYDIVVEKGSVELKIHSKSGDLFNEVFTENRKGSIEIAPKVRKNTVVLTGQKFRGKCDLSFEEIH